VITEFVRTQVGAWTSIPVSLARLLAALADAAETSVSLLQQLDERAEATNRVLHSFEDPLVRLADVVDATLVDQTVEALARLPVIMTRAAALTDRADGLLRGLEAPVRALGPLASAVDAGRIGGLVDRLEETLPGLVRLPDAESEVRRLRETLDRIYRVIDDIQGRFGVFPGANLLLRGERVRGETERPRAGTERRRGGTERQRGGTGRETANREDEGP
jgi:HAMP domain-containing protein